MRAVIALAVAGASLIGLGAQTAQPPVFRGGTTDIEIDARVVDRQHKFVRGLTIGDFELLVDGAPQPIASLRAVDLQIPGKQNVAANTNSPITTPAADGRVYVMLLDDLHIAPARATQLRRLARQFIEQRLAPGDRLQVSFTSGVTGQPLTADRRALLGAVDRFVARGLRSATLNVIDQQNERLPGPDPSAELTGGDRDDQQRLHEALVSLSALGTIARAFAPVHGLRKAILWFSDGIDYDPSDITKNPNASEIAQATVDVMRAAALANVTIYGIDARGATQLGDDAIEIKDMPDQRQVSGIGTTQRDELQRAQASLRALSDESGGFATVNTNSFGKTFDRIVDETSAYYILAYEPASDGRTHTVNVRVHRPGVVVTARREYRAPPASNAPAPAISPRVETNSRVASASTPPPVIDVAAIERLALTHLISGLNQMRAGHATAAATAFEDGRRLVAPLAEGADEPSFRQQWLLTAIDGLLLQGYFNQASQYANDALANGFSARVVTVMGIVRETAAAALAATESNRATMAALLNDAERAFRRVVESDREATQARLRHGRVLSLLGRGDEAQAELTAVTAQTRDARAAYLAHLFLGDMAERTGDAARARQQYEAALAIDPSFQSAYLALANLTERGGNLPGAQAIVSRCLARPHDAAGQDPWWQYQAGVGDLNAALEHLQQRVAR